MIDQNVSVSKSYGINNSQTKHNFIHPQ